MYAPDPINLTKGPEVELVKGVWCLLTDPVNQMDLTGGATCIKGSWYTFTKSIKAALAIGNTIPREYDAVYIPTIQQSGEPVSLEIVEALRDEAISLGLENSQSVTGAWRLENGKLGLEPIWLMHGRLSNKNFPEVRKFMQKVCRLTNQECVTVELNGQLEFIHSQQDINKPIGDQLTIEIKDLNISDLPSVSVNLESSRLWVIPLNDAEAASAIDLLRTNGESVIISHQHWGASWEKLEPENKRLLDAYRKANPQGRILGLQLKGDNPWNAQNIDSNDYSDSKGAIKAENGELAHIAEIINAKLSHFQTLVNRGYSGTVWFGEEAITREDAAVVAATNRNANGVTADDEARAIFDVRNAIWSEGRYGMRARVNVTTPNFLAVSNALALGEKPLSEQLLVCSDRIIYLGPRVEEFSALILRAKGTWSGGRGNGGYFGVIQPTASSIQKIIEHFESCDKVYTIPSDPMSIVNVPEGVSKEWVLEQKKYCWNKIEGELSQFSIAEQALILAAARVSFRIQSGNYRIGEPRFPSVHHTTEVFLRTIRESYNSDRVYFGPERSIIRASAFRAALSLVHDDLEDIGETVVGDSREALALLAWSEIEKDISPYLDKDALEQFRKSLNTLTLSQDGYPTDESVSEINADKEARLVKISDIRHNLETLADVNPEYGGIVLLSQYGEIFLESPHWEEIRTGLCRCIKNIDITSEGFVYYINRIILDIGETRLSVIQNRLRGIASSQEDSILSAKVDDICTALDEHLGVVNSTNTFPVKQQNIAGNSIRILGPVTSWGADLSVSGISIDEFKGAIIKTSNTLDKPVSGYIRKMEDGTLRYHMSRWPRRAGEAVPPISESRAILETFLNIVKELDPNASIQEYNFDQVSLAVLGLDEGYYEGRKSSLLARWPEASDKSIESLKRAITLEIGDISQFGINLQEYSDSSSLIEKLKNVSFSKLHSEDEVSRFISNTGLSYAPVDIFSFKPSYGVPYEEPAVVISGSHDELIHESTKLAAAMHQARFSIEASSGAINVEILEFSENAAAALR